MAKGKAVHVGHEYRMGGLKKEDGSVGWAVWTSSGEVHSMYPATDEGRAKALAAFHHLESSVEAASRPSHREPPDLGVRDVPATKACPFCAEDIKDGAIVCKHCGRELTTLIVPGVPQDRPVPPPPAPTPEPTVAGQAPLSMASEGIRYVIGQGVDFWGIWDKKAPGPPIERFPGGGEGAQQAWTRFRKLDKKPFLYIPTRSDATQDYVRAIFILLLLVLVGSVAYIYVHSATYRCDEIMPSLFSWPEGGETSLSGSCPASPYGADGFLDSPFEGTRVAQGGVGPGSALALHQSGSWVVDSLLQALGESAHDPQHPNHRHPRNRIFFQVYQQLSDRATSLM